LAIRARRKNREKIPCKEITQCVNFVAVVGELTPPVCKRLTVNPGLSARLEKAKKLIENGGSLIKSCQAAGTSHETYKKWTRSTPAKRSKYRAIAVAESVDSDDKIQMSPRQLAQFIRAFKAVE